jgi:ribosome maturation factor RimP
MRGLTKSPHIFYNNGVIYINKIIENIEDIITNDINDLGYNIEYVEYVDELGTKILRIVIEKKDLTNLNIDDCEKVSRKIENKIDSIMKDKEYTLEVSSAGLERQLKNIKLYKKYIGKDISIKLFKKTEFMKDVKLKEFECKLINVKEDKITVKTNIQNINVTFDVNIADIASAHTVFDYKSLFKNRKVDSNEE